MKDLALRILQEETDGFESQSRLRDDVIDAMIRFKNETEQLTIPAVVGQSEQLKALLEKLLNENMCSVVGDEFIEEALKGF